MTNAIKTLASESTELTNQAAEIDVITPSTLIRIDMDSKITLKVLAEKYNELLSAFELLAKNQAAPAAPVSRSRGPASEKVMTEEDARQVMLGDLKGDSHKEAAEKLGLSYGQIYSARKGFTFKPVYKEMIDTIKAEQAKQE